MFENIESVYFSNFIEHDVETKMSFCPKNDSVVAYTLQNELVIENLKNEENKKIFICEFDIDSILWSPTSELVSCLMSKQNLIQVWNLADLSWRCKIREGHFAISSIAWTPDSRHLLIVTEFNFKISIWSLVSSECAVIENPKLVKKCYAFSKCSNYMAVIEQNNSVDSVSIYSCDYWQILKSFPVLCGIEEIHFLPCDPVIAIVAAVVEDLKVMFYSLAGGLMHTLTKRNAKLGISSIPLSITNSYIIAGDSLEKISILNGKWFNEVCDMNLPESILSSETNVYRILEKSSDEETTPNAAETKKGEFYEVELERPVCIKRVKQKSYKTGLSILSVSPDEQYAAIVGSSMSNSVFLLCLKSFTFTDVIIQKENIKGVCWHPVIPILTIISGASHLDVWTPACCIRIFPPYDDRLLIKGVKWSPSGERLILNGKQSSALLHLPPFSSR